VQPRLLQRAGPATSPLLPPAVDAGGTVHPFLRLGADLLISREGRHGNSIETQSSLNVAQPGAPWYQLVSMGTEAGERELQMRL